MQNHHTSKRKAVAVRFFTYGVMTFAVVAISLICIMLLLGYRFDAKDGTIEQGGLVQFRSFPSGATIELDGKRLGFRTPGKYNVESGEHMVVMKLNGYQEWRKNTYVKPGELKWLNYARFVPTTLTSTSLASFGTVSDTLPSPDRRWYALQTDPAMPTVTLYDIRRPAQPVAATLQIPAEAYTNVPDQPHRFSLEEWDFGGRYLLVRHEVGTTIEYLRLDRTVANGAVNISKAFNLPLRDVHFSGNSGNVFYGLNETDIRRIDLGNQTITQPLVSEVESFELYGSKTIAFVAQRDEKRVVGVYEDDKEAAVRSFGLDQPVRIDITSYFDNNYLAISHGTTVEVIKDPESTSDSAGRAFASFTTQRPAGWLQFSSSGRFVVAGRGVEFVTYDMETDDIFTGSFDGTRSDEERPLQWIDDYYLAADTNELLAIGEFDGTNRHEIVRAAPGLAVTLSENGEYLFSIGKNEGGFTLQSTKMTND